MIFPKSIIGPHFSSGDIITFTFDGSDLTLRLPIIPKNKNTIDETALFTDFRNISTHDWDKNDQDYPCIQLATQLWCYEDARTLDDIAECALYVSLIEVTKQHSEQNTLLAQKSFEELMLSWMDYSFAANEKQDECLNEGTQSTTRYKSSSIARSHLNWLKAQVHFVPEAAACPICVMPIDSRFVLMISLEMESLHYAGRTNPYSNELLKQFERDLFEDFLSHIKIEYSPETIATIQSLKNKAPA